MSSNRKTVQIVTGVSDNGRAVMVEEVEIDESVVLREKTTATNAEPKTTEQFARHTLHAPATGSWAKGMAIQHNARARKARATAARSGVSPEFATHTPHWKTKSK